MVLFGVTTQSNKLKEFEILLYANTHITSNPSVGEFL